MKSRGRMGIKPLGKSGSIGKKHMKASKPRELVIPEEASFSASSVDDFLIWIYGPPGIGKSTFVSQFDDPVFLATEPGLKWLKTRPVVIKCWEDFQTYIKMCEDGKVKCSCHVVDTVDNLFKFCLVYVCAEKNIEHPADLEWGKGWEALFNEWHSHIVRLCSLGQGVVFIGHSTERDVTIRGLTSTKTMPAIQSTGHRSLNAIVDFIFYFGYATVKVRNSSTGKVSRKDKRFIFTRGNEYIETKDRTGRLPERMALDYPSFMEEFNRVLHANINEK